MKNLISLTLMIITLLLFNNEIKAQETSSIYIVEYVDQMSDTRSLRPSDDLKMYTPDKQAAFRMTASIDYKTQKFASIAARFVGIGDCNENNQLIILFENGDKATLLSWNKFNCEGTAYWNVNKSTYNHLKNNKISKIRITNVRSRESMTVDVLGNEPTYFMEVIESLEAGDFPIITE